MPSTDSASGAKGAQVAALAERMVRRRLDNGLDVVLLPDARPSRRPQRPLVAVNVWYHVGSKNERPGRTGFAHLFEHMLFQGSENVGTNDHFRWVQQAGGVANGSTWYDRTNYFETLPSQYLSLGLWLESDRMGYFLPGLTSEKLETQRQVVMNERRQRVDNQPYGRAYERLSELLFPAEHPYHWPVIGYMDDIAAASLDEVREFFSTYYGPNNAVLSLVGDFDVEEAWAEVERYFGPIPSGPEPPAVMIPPAAVMDAADLPNRVEATDSTDHTGPADPGTDDDASGSGEARETLEDRVALSRVYRAYRVPGVGEAGWYAADMLATALSGGRSSPLYEELVQRKQLAQDVAAFAQPTEAEGTWIVVSTARPGVDPREIEAVLDAHLERAGRGEITAAELERARNQKLTALHSDLQSVERVADRLSQFATFEGDPALLDTVIDRYMTVGAGEIAEAAGRYLGERQRAVVTVVPETPPETTPKETA